MLALIRTAQIDSDSLEVPAGPAALAGPSVPPPPPAPALLSVQSFDCPDADWMSESEHADEMNIHSPY